MALVRGVILLLLVMAGVSFALFAITGQPKYKRFGLAVLKWTLLAALGFFLVLFLDRLST
jgi:hypothetical protein